MQSRLVRLFIKLLFIMISMKFDGKNAQRGGKKRHPVDADSYIREEGLEYYYERELSHETNSHPSSIQPENIADTFGPKKCIAYIWKRQDFEGKTLLQNLSGVRMTSNMTR